MATLFTPLRMRMSSSIVLDEALVPFHRSGDRYGEPHSVMDYLTNTEGARVVACLAAARQGCSGLTLCCRINPRATHLIVTLSALSFVTIASLNPIWPHAIFQRKHAKSNCVGCVLSCPLPYTYSPPRDPFRADRHDHCVDS